MLLTRRSASVSSVNIGTKPSDSADLIVCRAAVVMFGFLRCASLIFYILFKIPVCLSQNRINRHLLLYLYGPNDRRKKASFG